MLNYPINGGSDDSLLKVKCGNDVTNIKYFIIYNKIVHSQEYLALRKMLVTNPFEVENLKNLNMPCLTVW
jgi:hypothetical protein